MIRNATAASINLEREFNSHKMVFTSTELLFYAALVLNLAYIIMYPVYSALHNFFHLIIFAFMILIFVSSKRINFSASKTMGLAAFVAMSVAVILINHSGIGVLVIIFWPLSIIYMFKHSALSTRYINRINILISAGWLFSVIASFSYTAAYFENFEVASEQGGINPNTMAIVIASTCLFLELYIDNTSKSKFIKTMIYAMSCLALYRTRARTSLVAFVAILLLEFFFKKKFIKSRRASTFLVIAVIAAGIIFPFIYVSLYNTGIVTYDTIFLGKRVFTGRQYIWMNLWDYVQNNKGSYFWGVGYNTELYSAGTFNLHNAYLMIFAQYGIPFLGVYLWYLIHSVYSFFGNKKQISDLQFKCYQIVLFVLIVGFGETVLSYLPNMIFIAMAIGIGCREKVGGLMV